MLYYLVSAAYVVICLLLLIVVLLQQGKGGDIANVFGGTSSQTAFGARTGPTVLSKATIVLAVLFALGAISLGILEQRGLSNSVVGGTAGPKTTPAPATAPAKPPAPEPKKQ